MTEERRRLDGLKAIKAYASLSEKTIKKYALSSDFPLYKVGAAPKPRYFSFTDEIDRWREGARKAEALELRTASRPDSIGVPKSSAKETSRLARRWLIASHASLAAAMLLLVPVPESRRKPEWEAHPENTTSTLVTTVAGESQVQVSLRKTPESHIDEISVLEFRDPESGELDRLELLDPFDRILFEDFSRRYAAVRLHRVDLDDNGLHEVLVTFLHQPNWPAYTVLYEPQFDRTRMVFASTGYHQFRGALDIDASGGDRELIFTDINNLMGWHTGIAAVRVDPMVGEDGTPMIGATTPNYDFQAGAFYGHLAWYALAPPGHCDTTECVTVDPRARTITSHFEGPMNFDYGGFDTTLSSPLPNRDRQERRKKAYRSLLEGELQLQAGKPKEALEAFQLAAEVLADAGDKYLLAWTRCSVARGLIANKDDRAEMLAEQLLDDYPDLRSMVAFELATTHHKYGGLRLAEQWYERGLGLGSKIGEGGRPIWEFLRGWVFIYVEQKRFDAARQLLAKYGDRAEGSGWIQYLHAFVDWRSGLNTPIKVPERPDTDDLARYWRTEIEYFSGALSTEEALALVDAELGRSSETTSLLLSLRAVLLHDEGRIDEALSLIEQAKAQVLLHPPKSITLRVHRPIVLERWEILNA